MADDTPTVEQALAELDAAVTLIERGSHTSDYRYEAAKTALIAAVRAEPWQLIDTAPKDADCVLLYRDGEGVRAGYWDFDHGWVSAETQGLTGGKMTPTHWMPMPRHSS